MATGINPAKMKREGQLFCQSSDKIQIAIGFLATQAVVHVHDLQLQIQVLSCLLKQMQQDNRIQATGNGDQNALAGVCETSFS